MGRFDQWNNVDDDQRGGFEEQKECYVFEEEKERYAFGMQREGSGGR